MSTQTLQQPYSKSHPALRLVGTNPHSPKSWSSKPAGTTASPLSNRVSQYALRIRTGMPA